jgi:DNA repair exonuclease SbcCD ATPase subunit
MSVVALHLYEKLNDAPDDKARSKAIVEAFSELEERYPDLKETATKRDLSETELRLQKEIEATKLEIKTVEANLQKGIEETRLEIKTVEANLQKEIEATRLEIKTVEANLQKGIEETRLEIEKVRSEIRSVETNFAKIVHKQTLWIIGAIGSIIMSIRLLEWFLTHLPH